MKRIASILIAVLIVFTMVAVGTISAFAKESEGENHSSSDLTFSAYSEDGGPKNASVFSEGSLAIIIGVTCAVVLGFGGFFLGKAVEKRKKPADSNK